MTFIPEEQGTKVKFWVEEGTKAILGNMEHKKTIFDSWGTGKQAYLFQGNKGTVIPLGGSHKRSNFQTIHQFVCLFIRLSTRHIKWCLWSTDSMHVKTCILIVLQKAYTVMCDPIPWSTPHLQKSMQQRYMKCHCCPGNTPQARTMPGHNRMFRWFLWFCKAHISFFYEIRKIVTLIFVSLTSDPGYFMH